MFKIIKESENGLVDKMLKSCKRDEDVNEFADTMLEDVRDNDEDATKEEIIEALNKAGIADEVYEITDETNNPEEGAISNFVYLLTEDGKDLGINIDYYQWIGVFDTECGKIVYLGDGWNGFYMNKQTFINVINKYIEKEQ